MKRNPVAEEDRASIADWFARWGDLVANVDFKRSREMFVDDIVSFGSLVAMVTSREALEAQQWRAIWPTILDYRYDLATLETAVSPDRLMAMGAVMFRSTGLHPDGTRFERPGRATVTLMRTALDAPWLGTHTHVSLTPGTPTPSYGQRREAP